jgi:predicted LPLAT superfamily acyltransferase
MSSTVTAPEWTRRPERGILLVYRFMAWFSLRAGRTPARALIRVGTIWFLLFGGAAGRASRDYLARVHGRPATTAERYEHFFTFASTLHDRLFFLKDRFDVFDLHVDGADSLRSDGALLMGAHIGSFEALRSAGRGIGGRRVAMAMYEANAPKLRAVLATIDPRLEADIVPLGQLDSMLELDARLESGALVGVLADRTLEGDTHGTVQLDFLGAPARFPLGPMRMAAALRRPVYFMSALYRGGNRYDVSFERLADFSAVSDARGEREREVREAVARYVAMLERRCRTAPANWSNFYPFWEA